MKQRFLDNLKFYLPVALVVFFALPGTASLVLGGQRLHSLDFLAVNVFFATLFLLVLTASVRYWAKMMVSVPLALLFFFVEVGLVRGKTPELALLGTMFETSLFISFFPVPLLFLFICLMDRRRRSPVTLIGVYVLGVFFGAYAGLIHSTYGSRDWLAMQDVQERLLSDNYKSLGELTLECQASVSLGNRHGCTSLVNESIKFSNCNHRGSESEVEECYHSLVPSHRGAEIANEIPAHIPEPQTVPRTHFPSLALH